MSIEKIVDKHLEKCYKEHGVKITVPYLTAVHKIAKELAQHHYDKGFEVGVLVGSLVGISIITVIIKLISLI